MGMSNITSRVPYGEGYVDMHDTECNGLDEDCLNSCVFAERCDICMEVKCTVDTSVCHNCKDEEEVDDEV